MNKITVFMLLTVGVLLYGNAGWSEEQPLTPKHGLSMYGELKYSAGFQHFDYANPNAPKGGRVRRAVEDTFDNLNPFILKGIAAEGMGGTFSTLMMGSEDEPFSKYGLVAESVELPEDRSWVIFNLRPQARFHDHSPITAEDVVFSFDILTSQGHPFYRSYYADVAKAEALSPHRVRFQFKNNNNRELPLIVADLPILSKAYWQNRVFDKTTLEAPLGSGPYKVVAVQPGRSITYARVKDYWAADLPVQKGFNNFDELHYDYYRDPTVKFEAFKAHAYDFHEENIAKNWATGYDFPAVKAGKVKREAIPHERPTGMQAFVMNIRKPIFQDRRVREALNYLFDFEWVNKNLFYSAYTRTSSYFSNSELAAQGLPSEAERAILLPYQSQLPPRVLTEAFQLPVTDGSGNIREGLRYALQLLKEAGWVMQQNRLIQVETQQPMSFEMLLVSSSFERIVLPFKKNLERLGIQMEVRTIDAAQYERRVNSFAFDMIVHSFGQSLSPGNEQRDLWHSSVADIPGSRNLIGIRNPVVDALVEKMIHAPDRQSLVDYTRALDRVLLWEFYVIPHWHVKTFRIAYWDQFEHPQQFPKYALGFDNWWINAEKAAQFPLEKNN